MYRRTQLVVLLPLLIFSLLVGCSESADRGPVDEARAIQMAKTAGPPGDQYIVQLDPGTDARRFAADAAGAHGLSLGHVYSSALRGFVFRGSATAARQLARRPGVRSVEKDQPIALAQQTIPSGIDRIDADQNSAASIDGTDDRVDADVAVLDTGVDAAHPDLNVVQSVDCVGGAGCTMGGDDVNGHGTHVAGTISALDNGSGVVGVAPGARIHAIKVIEPGVYASIADVIAGLDWVVANAPEVDVINMSLGGTGCISSLHTAVQSAVNSGIYIAVAAGNSGVDISGNGAFGDCDDVIPGSYPEVATIASMVDTDGAPGGAGTSSYYGDDDSFASYSNYSGSDHTSNPVNSPGAAIDLLLPGTNITSTCPGGTYCAKTGTSMASPHAAGLAALHYATYGDQSDAAGVYAVRQSLIDSAAGQSTSDGLAVLDDPDPNPEPVGMASLSGTTSDPDPTPEPDPTTTPELTPSSQNALANPTQTMTYQYSVCNAGNSLGSYSATTSSSWPSSVSPTLVSDLASGACATLYVEHTVPSTAADGELDSGTLTVDSGSELASATFETTADAPSWAVSISPGQQAGIGAPGETLLYDYTVCNGGNRADSYALSTSSTWAATVTPTQISDLSPGACQTATVAHTMPAIGQDGDIDAGMLTVASSSASAPATFESTLDVPEPEPDPTTTPELSPSAQTNTANPGDTVTYQYSLCNAGNSAGTYSIATSSSWASNVSPSVVSDLAAGACATLSVEHIIASTAADGAVDTGSLAVDSGSEIATATFETTADAPVWAMSVSPSQQMGFGALGETLSYDYTVCNDGNRTDTYTLSTSSAWAATVTPTQISDLSPGACQTATVSHTLPSSGQDGDLDAGVLTLDSSNTSATASFESTLDVPEPEPEPLSVSDMSPGTIRAGDTIRVKVYGTGFKPGLTAEFVGGKGRAPRVDLLTVDDSNTLSVTVSTKSGGPRGSRIFDLVLTDSTGTSVVLPGALTVTR